MADETLTEARENREDTRSLIITSPIFHKK